MNSYIILLTILNLLSATGYSVIAPLLPIISSAHRISETISGLIFSSYSIANIIIIPFIPNIFNKIPKKISFQLSALIESITAMIFGCLYYIENKNIFIFVSFFNRFTQGIAAAITAILIYSLAVTISQKKEIKKNIAMVEIGYSLGLAIGPILGSYLYKYYNFLTPFLFLGILKLICVILIIKLPIQDECSTYTNNNFLSIIFQPKILLTFLANVVELSSVNFYYPVIGEHLSKFYKLSLETSSIFFDIQILSYFISFYFVSSIFNSFGSKLTISFGLLINSLFVTFLFPASLFPRKLIIIIIGMILLGPAQALVNIPSMEDYLNTLKFYFDFEDSDANDLSSMLFNLSINLGDAIGPIIGGFFTEIKNFEYACFYVSIMDVLMFFLFILGNLNSIAIQIKFSEKVKKKKYKKMIDEIDIKNVKLLKKKESESENDYKTDFSTKKRKKMVKKIKKEFMIRFSDMKVGKALTTLLFSNDLNDEEDIEEENEQKLKLNSRKHSGSIEFSNNEIENIKEESSEG